MSLDQLPSLPATGRINQKMRTRRELLRGARELMEDVKPVTVAAAAKRVGISTATAYRYYSDPETLRLEAVIEMDLGAAEGLSDDIEETLSEIENPLDRILAAHRGMVNFARKNEAAYRLFSAKRNELIASDKAAKSSPQSQRIAIIEMALSPVRSKISAPEFQTAVNALCATCGPEPYFTLKDFCHLPDDEIDRICALNIETLAKSLKIA